MFPISQKLIIIALLLFLLPLAVLAQGPDLGQNPGTLGGVGTTILRILNVVVLIIMSLALIYFFWGLAQYILSAGDDAKKGEGRNIMIYGVVALFVMVAVWGLVGILKRTFIENSGVGTNAPNVNNLLPNYKP